MCALARNQGPLAKTVSQGAVGAETALESDLMSGVPILRRVAGRRPAHDSPTARFPHNGSNLSRVARRAAYAD